MNVGERGGVSRLTSPVSKIRQNSVSQFASRSTIILAMFVSLSQRLQRLIRLPGLLGVAAWLLFGSVGDSSCLASCGDYLVHQPVHDQTALSPNSVPDPVSDVPAIPCHGPSCSRAPNVPLVPARTILEVSFHEWACLCLLCWSDDDSSPDWLMETETRLAWHTSQPLDRPPVSI